MIGRVCRHLARPAPSRSNASDLVGYLGSAGAGGVLVDHGFVWGIVTAAIAATVAIVVDVVADIVATVLEGRPQ